VLLNLSFYNWNLVARTAAVFFDVDFTLIHPGPRFQGVGYQTTCARHGLEVDPSGFEAAVAGAAATLESTDQLYQDSLYINYTRRIIELMGGTGPGADLAAREIYDEWAEHHHFSLYDDVTGTLEQLHDRGVRLGLISNSHRPLESFQAHFQLDSLISVSVSSSELGFLKPHPRIFQAALDLMQVPAGEAAMVGDSLAQDVLGARQAGMRGILLDRGGSAAPDDAGIPVIRSLAELLQLVEA
jgi:putative hydrolase of the HAD superfamily